MIGPREVTVALVCGSTLILFGLVPGLFQALIDGIHEFSEALRFSSPTRPGHRQETRQPVWLAGMGAALITLTLLEYASN